LAFHSHRDDDEPTSKTIIDTDGYRSSPPYPPRLRGEGKEGAEGRQRDAGNEATALALL